MPLSFGPWTDAPDEITASSHTWYAGALNAHGNTTWAQPGDSTVIGWVEVEQLNPDFEPAFESSAADAAGGFGAAATVTLGVSSSSGAIQSEADHVDASGYTQATASIRVMSPDTDSLSFPLIGPDPSTWPPHVISIEWETPAVAVPIAGSLHVTGYVQGVSTTPDGFVRVGEILASDYTIDGLGRPVVNGWAVTKAQAGGVLATLPLNTGSHAVAPFDLGEQPFDAHGRIVLSLVLSFITDGVWDYATPFPGVAIGQDAALLGVSPPSPPAGGNLPNFTMRYHQPRYRFVYDIVLPQRQYPRDDGLAMSTQRFWPQRTSRQFGVRKGPVSTFW